MFQAMDEALRARRKGLVWGRLTGLWLDGLGIGIGPVVNIQMTSIFDVLMINC